ncbi:MAG: InlB B-repeat-containing protein [Treponema sp.]|jgi:hypothetical protein|nr:InlB B-repeat-containing protein [Treponema sp.]
MAPHPDGKRNHARPGKEGNLPTSGQYTVTFHTAGGGSAPEPQTLAAGETAVEPGLTAEPELAAEGLYRHVISWYTDAACTAVWDFTAPVTQNLDLYGNGTVSPVNLDNQSGAHTLAKALGYIAEQSLSAAASYTIVLDGNYPMPGIIRTTVDEPSAVANVKNPNAVITLAGKGPVEISPSTSGALFYIAAGELILDKNITLKGGYGGMALVSVDGSSASLLMKTGAKITGNSSSHFSGGVFVRGGSFTMSGGEISGNDDHGVYVYRGSFTMKAGEISGNDGSGVYAGGGSFTMSGGKISANNESGVYAGSGFTMSGGEISGNYGGKISGMYIGNGGGVTVLGGGSFEMSGGEIRGNTASDSGGGVYCFYGSFSKTGGVVYGSNADTSLKNTAGSDDTNGHAVYYEGNEGKYYHDTTLNAGDDISTVALPASGTGNNWTKKQP